MRIFADNLVWLIYLQDKLFGVKMQQARFKLADVTDPNALREMVSAEYNKLRAEEEILELEMKNLGKDNFFKKVNNFHYSSLPCVLFYINKSSFRNFMR